MALQSTTPLNKKSSNRRGLLVTVGGVAVAISAAMMSGTDWMPTAATVAQETVRRMIAPGVEAAWVRNGNVVTDADGDVWECGNIESAEPRDWDCKPLNSSVQSDRGENPAVAMRLDSGQWLVFEKRGAELVDMSGATWVCASRTAGATLAANGCSRKD